ncbi:hypothetical protein CTH_10044 (plasmid) [Carboxydocella thermautotrophica]|nr:hypothetical protein CTH_10044 [Carboxydocella thermautotrophica]
MKKVLLILGIAFLLVFGFESIALAATWDDPGGIINKTASKIKGLGIGIAMLGFLASWVISSLSLGDESVIAKGKKGATMAVVSGLVLAVGVQIYQWFLQ